MNKEKTVTINIDTIETLKDFANEVLKFDSDINIYHDHGTYYDAKSIMAIFALGLDAPHYLEIISDNEEEIARFKDVMQKFI